MVRGDAAAGAPLHGSLCGEKDDELGRGMDGGKRLVRGDAPMVHYVVRREGKGTEGGRGQQEAGRRGRRGGFLCARWWEGRGRQGGGGGERGRQEVRATGEKATLSREDLADAAIPRHTIHVTPLSRLQHPCHTLPQHNTAPTMRSSSTPCNLFTAHKPFDG